MTRQESVKLNINKSTIRQQAFGKIANFVVNSRINFARNFIFGRK